MSIYEYVDPTTAELDKLFWSLVPLIAEQAGVSEADALYHLRRTWADRIKTYKGYEAIDFRDDGRAAVWRVRLTIWGGEGYQSQFADTDDGRPLDHDGATLLHGLPAVAEWVRELCAQAHPACSLDGLSEATLAGKIKSLRVSLSNQGGSCIWRIRYTVTPPEAPANAAAAAPGVNLLKLARPKAAQLQHFLAHVRVTREESPRHRQ